MIRNHFEPQNVSTENQNSSKFFAIFGKEIRWGIKSLVAHTKEKRENNNNNNTTIHLKHNINILSAVREGVKTKS